MVYRADTTFEQVEKIKRIASTICDEFGITIDELSKNQKVNGTSSVKTVFISYARTIAMNILARDMKQKFVANILNCKDHSCVSTAKTRLKLLVEVNPLVQQKLESIENKLKL
jgi:chromosomal replication initiation ATPase DnaA